MFIVFRDTCRGTLRLDFPEFISCVILPSNGEDGPPIWLTMSGAVFAH